MFLFKILTIVWLIAGLALGAMACADETAGIAEESIGIGVGDDVDPTAPDYSFRDIASVSIGSAICGLRADGILVCLGLPYNPLEGAMLRLPEAAFKSVAIGGLHGCGVKTDDAVVCWWINPPSSYDYDELTQPAGAFRSISSGDNYTCGVRTDATLDCWWAVAERNPDAADYGEATPPDGEFLSVSAGGDHACAVRADHTVACWGRNEKSELGFPGGGQASPPPGQFRAVSAGENHTCGVRMDGAVECWGGEHNPALWPAGEFRSISAGDAFTCGARSDGSLVCWGPDDSDDYGMPELISANNSAPPGNDFQSVVVGDGYNCGVKAGGMVECWGATFPVFSAHGGRLRYHKAGGVAYRCGIRMDETGASDFCWRVDGSGEVPPPRFATISMNGYALCGITLDGVIACTGFDVSLAGDYESVTIVSDPPFFGAVCAARADDDVLDCQPSAENELLLLPGYELPPVAFRYLASGDWGDTCGVRTDDGAAVCWELSGHDNEMETIDGPFQSVAVGLMHACGLRTDRKVVCWGHDYDGRAIPPDGKFLAITAGDEHTCGLRADDTVACWGSDEYTDEATTPAGKFRAVSAGARHTCGLRDDETVVCWGDNWVGQITPPAGKFRSVVSGGDDTCGLRHDGSLECWGGHTHRHATLIHDGKEHVCGARSDGARVCWARGARGDTPLPRFLSVSVGWRYVCGITDAASIACVSEYGDYHSDAQVRPPPGTFKTVSAGKHHACGVRADDTAACWGDRVGPTPAGLFQSVSAGDTGNACGVKMDGGVTCWGDYAAGIKTTPAGQFKSVGAGGRYDCGIKADGTVACWDDDGTAGYTLPGEYQSLSVGYRNVCGVRRDGSAACWWEAEAEEYAAHRADIGAFRSVSVGDEYACGVTTDGALFCWNTRPYPLSPKLATVAGNFLEVSARDDSVCGLQADGALKCWSGHQLINSQAVFDPSRQIQ